MKNAPGTEFRPVEDREHLGKPVIVGITVRVYETPVEDLWDALTTPERLVRWFLPGEGDSKLGRPRRDGCRLGPRARGPEAALRQRVRRDRASCIRGLDDVERGKGVRPHER